MGSVSTDIVIILLGANPNVIPSIKAHLIDACNDSESMRQRVVPRRARRAHATSRVANRDNNPGFQPNTDGKHA